MAKTTAKRGQSKYPFKTLKIKESFEVEEEKRHSVNTLAKKFGDSQEPKKLFTIRYDDQHVLRCWRLK